MGSLRLGPPALTLVLAARAGDLEGFRAELFDLEPAERDQALRAFRA